MDRIGRVGAQDHVAGRCDRLRHVGEAFLGAKGGDDLRIWVQLDAEATGVIGGLGTTQPGNALRRRITMRARVLNGLAELVDNRLRSGKIRIAHAEVDDVSTGRSRACFQTVDLFENIGRQTPDFVKLFHLQTSFGARSRQRLKPWETVRCGERPSMRPLNALRPNHRKGKR